MTSTTPEVEAVLALVRRHGGRITTARRAVVTTLLQGHDRHLTADDVATAVQRDHPEVHLTTVYRTLEALEGLGVVRHVHLGHGPSTYHLASDHHHHAVCDGCGTVLELPGDLFDAVAARVVAEHGFAAATPHFALTGRCSACR